MKLLMAAICAATSSPVETTLNSLSWAAMSGCVAKALAVWIIWMRQVLAMKPLASAMRNGPFLAGNLKNLVLSDQGAKQPGSAAGPATTSGPAAKAGAEKAQAAVNIAPPTAATTTWRKRFMVFLPLASRSAGLIEASSPSSAVLFVQSVVNNAAPENPPDRPDGSRVCLR